MPRHVAAKQRAPPPTYRDSGGLPLGPCSTQVMLPLEPCSAHTVQLKLYERRSHASIFITKASCKGQECIFQQHHREHGAVAMDGRDGLLLHSAEPTMSAQR